MAMRQFLLLFGLIWLVGSAGAGAQQALSGLARLTGDGLELTERRGRVEIEMGLTQPVPWRVFTLDGPPRVVVDFSELDWSNAGAEVAATQAEQIDTITVGTFRPGWSRMVIALAGPMAVTEAEMATQDGGARVRLLLTASDATSFAASAGAPDSALFHEARGLGLPPRARPEGARGLMVVVDPGHGGIDPGTERGGLREADLMLTFARELEEVLLRAGLFDVVLTRDDDIFVPLEERVTIARRAGADVFLSLHADALAEGHAQGATVYTLADEASDLASATLAERHDRADLLAGVDLSSSDDAVALVLMDLARTETTPRAERLAEALIAGIHSATQSTFKRPHLHAAFSVLKAPDIPSALIELGFLSSERDRAKLADPSWRLSAAQGIRDGLLQWAREDAAAAERLLR
jgi:N-acetylmuramoyl-L-alanine amidase